MSAIEYSLRDANVNERYGGSLNPCPITLLGPFPFTFATSGLTSGVALVALPAGAVIYDVGIAVTVSFNGTTPTADVGTFSGGTSGMFAVLGGAAVDLTSAATAVPNNAGLAVASSLGDWLSLAANANSASGQAIATATATLALVVSQDGTKGGAATGATAGAGQVYVLASTPTV